MIKKSFYVFVFIGIALSFVLCDKRIPIARVGNFIIYSDELSERIERNRGPVNSFQEIMNLVNNIVNDKLKLCDAIQSGFDQDSVVVARSQDYEARQLYSHIVEHDVINKVVTESMVRERYKLLSKEWHARHILLPASKDSLALIETLNSFRGRALRGEDFGELARAYSKDLKTAGKNGDLGFIQYDLNQWDKRFLDVLASLTVGHVSGIVRTNLGFHLIKLEQVRDVQQQPYSEAKNDIKNTLIRENVAGLDSAFYHYRSDIEQRYDAKQISANIDSLLHLIKRVEAEHSAEKVNLQRDPRQFRGVLTDEERTFPLATFRGGVYHVDDMLETYNQISPMRRPLFNNKPAIEEFLSRNVPRVLMIRLAYERGMQKDPEIRRAVQKEKESQMISRINRVKIDRNADVSDEELRQYYEDNPHLYENNIRVNVQEILMSNVEMAQAVHEKALSGDDFDTLAREFNEREDTKEQNGVLGFLTLRDYGMVSRTAVAMKSGEISEPIKNNNRYSIIKILDRQADDLKPFEEVRLKIRREQRNEKRKRLMDEWMTTLGNNYNVTIYTDVIKKEFEIADE